MFLLLVLAAGLNASAPASLTLAQAIAQAFDVRVENLSREPSLQRDVFAVIGQPLELGGKRQLRIGIATADRDLALAGLHSTDATHRAAR